MTKQGWVGAVEAGPEVGAEGVGLEGRDTTLSSSGVGDDYGDEGVVVGLSVDARWVVSCSKVSTLLATLESKSDFF